MANPNYSYPPQDAYSPSTRGRYEPDYISANTYAPSPEPGRRDSHSQGYGNITQYQYDQPYLPYEPDQRLSHHSRPRRGSRYESASSSASSSEDERPARRSSRKGSGHKHSSSSHSGALDQTNRPKPLDKAKEHFSTSDRGVGAGMLGAIAGAVVAQETAQRNGKGSVGATIAGLVLGGLAGNALERGYDKKQEKQKELAEEYEKRRGDR